MGAEWRGGLLMEAELELEIVDFVEKHPVVACGG